MGPNDDVTGGADGAGEGNPPDEVEGNPPEAGRFGLFAPEDKFKLKPPTESKLRESKGFCPLGLGDGKAFGYPIPGVD